MTKHQALHNLLRKKYPDQKDFQIESGFEGDCLWAWIDKKKKEQCFIFLEAKNIYKGFWEEERESVGNKKDWKLQNGWYFKEVDEP